MILAEGLTKHFGATAAVDDVSFEAQPGTLVGLVGHDGAGKTTTLRMLVGHVTPTAGSSAILGRPFAALDHPLRRVGVMLDDDVHPARTARDHLRIAAALAGLDDARVDAVLGVVGLEDEAGWRGRSLTRGMRRRLGIATALLAEPEVIILDEPATGLDPEGVRWLRSLLRSLADDGRTLLVSSIGADEVEEIADTVLVMDRGSLLTESSPRDLTAAQMEVLVRTPGAEVLAEELRGAGISPSAVTSDEVRVPDVPVRVVSERAQASGVPVWEIREDEPSLEEAVVELTRDASANGAHDGGEPEDSGDDGAAPDVPDEAETALDAELADLPAFESCRVVAVLAPAAELGRTTLSFLLADTLAACTETATLAVGLSCDRQRLSMPAAHDRRTSLGLTDLLGDLPAFDESAHISPYVSVTRFGAHVLSGPADAQELRAVDPDQLDALLDFAGRFYPVVVVDAGELSERSLRAAVRRADRVLLLGAPGAVDDLDDAGGVLAAIEAERDDAAVLVFNLVEEERVRAQGHGGGSGSHVLVPRDRELVRALDGGDFELSAVGATTRTALKRLALTVARGLG